MQHSTQVSLLAQEMALQTKLEGNCWQKLGKLLARPSGGQLGIPTGHSICVINAADMSDEAPKLQKWLVKHTDLCEGQILLSSRVGSEHSRLQSR